MTLPITGAGPSGAGGELAYFLNAPFTGADQGYANAQVLNTVAEGITAGQLTVTEVDGTLALASNKCAFTAQGSPAFGDLQLVSQSITRAFALPLLCTINKTLANKYSPIVFWNNDGSFTGDWSELEAVAWHFTDTSEIYLLNRAAVQAVLIAYTQGVDYQLAMVLGGYDASGNPWYTGQTPASYLYGLAIFIKGGAFATWSRLFQSTLHNDDPVYAVAAFYDASGTIDDIRVPDTSLSTLFQPTHLSTFDAANGTSLDAITPEIGGGWTEQAGNMDIQSNRANLVTGIAKSTIESGLGDAVVSCTINMTAPAVTAGLIVRYEDNNNYWLVYLLTATNKMDLYEVNGGGLTKRATASVVIDSGIDYKVLVLLTGTTIRCFVDDGSTAGYISAFNQTKTKHGLYCDTNVTVRFDNFAIYPHTDASYDSALDAV